MDAATAAAIFAAAARSTAWTRTNLGLTAEVTHAGQTWTVQLPDAGGQAVQARIAGSYGYGGTDVLDVVATWAQTVGVADAAMAAVRPS